MPLVETLIRVRRRTRRWGSALGLSLLVALVSAATIPGHAIAAPPVPPVAVGDPEPETPPDPIASRIAELEAIEAPNEDQKSELAELQSAASFAGQATTAKAREQSELKRAEATTSLLEQMEKDLATARAALASPVEVELPSVQSDADMADIEKARDAIETRHESAKGQLAAAVKLLEEAQARIDDSRARVKAIPDELATARSRQEEIDQAIAVAEAGEQTALRRAQLANLRAERTALTATTAALDQELKTTNQRKTLREKRLELAQAHVDQAQRFAAAIQKQLDAIRARIAGRRSADAERAKRDAESAHPLVQAILARNAELADEQARVVASQSRWNDERDEVGAALDQWEQSFNKIKLQVDRVGLNDVIGLRLHSLRSQLQDLRRYESKSREVLAEIKRAQSQVIKLDEASFADPEAEAERRVEGLRDPVPPDERNQLVTAATEALAKQQEYVGTLEDGYESYIDQTLMGLHDEIERLSTLVDTFLEYVQQRILWIPSADPVGFDTVRQCWDALVWLFDGRNWVELGDRVGRYASLNLYSVALWFIPFAALLGLRRTLLHRIDDLANRVKRASTDRFVYTVRVANMTVLLSVTWPLLLWGLSRLTSSAAGNSDFAQGVAMGLNRASVALLFLRLLMQACRSRGLGEAHFRWRNEHTLLTRRSLRWLTAIVLPCVLVVTLTEIESFRTQHHSLGRLLFCVSMIALGVFAWRMLHPRTGVLDRFLASSTGGWLDRLRPIWFSAAVLVGPMLAVLACAGYFLTARELMSNIFWSAGLILVAGLTFDVGKRWLFVAHRRLALEQMRERFEAERAARLEGESEERSEELPALEDVEIDIDTINQQTHRMLVNAFVLTLIIGLAAVWAEVLPALGMLDQVKVWPPGVVSTTTGPNGETITPSIISLADIGIALVVLLVTIAISRNIPGFLEILVLRRLPMSAGSRYAATTLVRYAILVVGLVLTFDAIGIGWGKVQWLAAAISVGLGFGLQEIFANFVSGLIILTERPIRVGDTVTIGEVSGVVSRIQMRATTVTNWDRKELIIPNKEFVTGQIINWTLSNAILRVTIPVGIAYGSDTEKAQRLLLQVATSNTSVLAEPAPRAFFIGFGDSTLDYELRIFIDDVDNFSAIRDRINSEIHRVLGEAGIEIAFPQRDLHIRSTVVTNPTEAVGVEPMYRPTD